MKHYLIIVFLLLIITKVHAQNEIIWDKEQLVMELQKETRNLKNMKMDTLPVNDSSKASLKLYIKTLKKYTDQLMYNSEKIHSTDSEFIYSLNRDLHGLKNVYLSNYNLQGVVEDLQPKIKSLDNLTISSAESFTDISVDVITTDLLGKVIPNCTVFWNYWLDYTNPNPRSSFNNPTSPSNGKLKPGIYDIWVVKPGSSQRYPPHPTKKTIETSPDGKSTVIKIIVN